MRKFIWPIVVISIIGVFWFVSSKDGTNQTNKMDTTDQSGQTNQADTTDQTDQNVDVLPAKVLIDVPFTSQSPFGDWRDPRQQDGCEEAAVLMSMAWVNGESISKDAALAKILAMSDWEQERYGSFHDTSAEDTAKRLFNTYFNYDRVRVEYDIGVDDIKKELAEGRLVIVPANGQKLGNPNFTGAGPERHMLVIRGFNEGKRIFITNDPGTRKGEGYQYNYNVLLGAIRDYPSGDHVPMTVERRAMIVVEK